MGVDITAQWSPVVGVCRNCMGGFGRQQADLAAFCSDECEQAHAARMSARRARYRAWFRRVLATLTGQVG